MKSIKLPESTGDPLKDAMREMHILRANGIGSGLASHRQVKYTQKTDNNMEKQYNKMAKGLDNFFKKAAFDTSTGGNTGNEKSPVAGSVKV